MSNINIRFLHFKTVINAFLLKIKSGAELDRISNDTFLNEYLFFNEEKLRAVINEYYEHLEGWKKFFNISNRLDRHKVSALTIHYLLKHKPIEQRKKSKEIAISIFINEIIALNIGMALLKEGNHPFNSISPVLRASIYRSLNFHAKQLDNNTNYNNCIKDVISLLAIIMFQIENDHSRI